jgi:hypothetical protein
MYFWERTGMIEADSSEALRKACQYELKTESTKERSPTELRCASFPARLSVTWGAVKGQDERPLSGAPLTAPHVTTGGLCRWKAINKVGRHVGLDFYDLLIEGVYTSLRFSFAKIGVNEFYKKGCQEKTSASTGVEMFSRDPAHPAHWNLASLEKFDLCPF